MYCYRTKDLILMLKYSMKNNLYNIVTGEEKGNVAQYYDFLAVLIRVIWEVIKFQSIIGESAFPGKFEYGFNKKVVPFNLETELYFPAMTQTSVSVSRKLRQHTRDPFVYATDLLIGSQSNKSVPYLWELQNYTPFKNLVDETNTLARRFSKTSNGIQFTPHNSLTSILLAGATTQSRAIVQLGLILGEDAKPNSAIMTAKTELEHIETLENDLGISSLQQQSTLPAHRRQYNAFDFADQSGMNRKLLKVLGLGDAIGCPAALRLKPDAIELVNDFKQAILRSCYAHKVPIPQEVAIQVRDWLDDAMRTTVLAESAHHALAITDEVHRWYKTLSNELKQNIDENDRFLIEGGVQRGHREGKYTPVTCPWKRGKE